MSGLEKKPLIRRRKSSSGYFVGKHHGFVVRKIARVSRRSRRDFAGPRRPTLVRSVIREVSGYAAYEKRIIECLRNNLDKKALRIAKRKLGTHVKAKKKREELARIVASQKLQRN